MDNKMNETNTNVISPLIDNETSNSNSNSNSNSIPICRLCLQAQDYWGNFAIEYDNNVIQHKSCMAKYTKNRRALKKVVFKVRYQEYFGDLRPAGIVDRGAMKVKEKTKKELKENKKNNQKMIEARCEWARKCKEEKRKLKIKDKENEINDFIKAWDEKRKVDGASIIGESHRREEN